MLNIVIRPSRLLAALMVAAHAAAAAAAVAAPPWITIPMWLLLAGNCTACLRRDALLRHADSTVRITIHRDGAVHVWTRGGQWRQCELCADTFVSPWLTALNLVVIGSGTNLRVVLLRDSVDAADFRRLRVRLRWAGSGAASTAGRAAHDAPKGSMWNRLFPALCQKPSDFQR